MIDTRFTSFQAKFDETLSVLKEKDNRIQNLQKDLDGKVNRIVAQYNYCFRLRCS